MEMHLRRVLLVIAHVGLTTGLAPTICAEDVVAYVQEAVGWGSSVTNPTGRLSSCACMLDARSGFTPLHEVAKRGGRRAGGVIGVLVAHYADVMEVDTRGATALHLAAMQGEVPATAALITAAVRARYQTNLLFARDKNGKTALDLADEGGHVDIARYLVSLGGERGDRALAYDECSWPLADAVLLGNMGSFVAEVDKPIVNRSKGSSGANCFYPPASNEKSLLHVALGIAELQAAPGGLDVTQAILARGGNASRQDAFGELPLNRAGRADRVDLVNALLAAMPTGGVDAQDVRGRTALIEASRVGARNAASTLMSGGASPDVRDLSGFTALDYAKREGHENVVAAIDMAIRLPPAQLSRPGAFYNSQDFTEPPPEPEEESTDIVYIIGIAVGACLGITTTALMAIGGRKLWKRRCKAYAQGEMAVLPENGPDDTRDSLRKAIERDPPKKENREKKKRAKNPEKLAEQPVNSLVPPGQIGTDSSDGDSHTPARNRRPPVTTVKAPGQQPRERPSRGHRSLSPTVSNSHTLLDAEVSPNADRATKPRQKPLKDRDSASLPPPPSPSAADAQGKSSRIMSAAAAQAAGSGRWTCSKCGEQNRADREVCNNCGQPKAASLDRQSFFHSESVEETAAEKAVRLAKEVAAQSRNRWANSSSGSTPTPLRGIARSASRSESTSSAESSPRENHRASQAAKAKATAKSRGPPASAGSSATSTSGGLRAAGATPERSPAPLDTQLPAALRGKADFEPSGRSTGSSQMQAERQGSLKARSKAKPKAKSTAQQSILCVL